MVGINETNTANSSSAAAVADGASAAVQTKTVEMGPLKSASHVKLLIKSSNQQYEDHMIESDLIWTVKRLKSHLSVVYPSKPPVAEQKLIYSGQLLNDNLQLKDVIRSYKDVYTHNHIIHLVYTPKNLLPSTASKANQRKSPLAQNSPSGASGTSGESAARTIGLNMASGDGVRQRHTAAGNSGTNQQTTIGNIQQQQQIFPHLMTPQLMSAAGIPCPPQFNPNIVNGYGSPYNFQAMLMQHSAMYNWMQQVYSQYMEQCLRLSANNSDGDAAAANTYPATFSAFTAQHFPQLYQQQFPSTVMTPVAADTNAAPAPAAVNLAAGVANGERQGQQQQPALLAPAAAGRIPNLPQDEQENRDWLDNFFSITRLALFLTLLYFNSSPLRCFVVVIIAGGIYLYHIGVFRFRNERNNNNLNRNNNAAQNAAVDQIRQGVDQQENAAAAPEREENNENNAEGETQAETTTDAPGNANHESVFSTIRTFVVSFFTSLLPETPAL